MALSLLLHVIVIGIILSRLPLRFLTFLGVFVYFLVFHLTLGYYLQQNRERFTPKMPLEDDYWNYQKAREKKSPFDPIPEDRKKIEEDVQDEELRILRQKEEAKDQPRTNP